MTLKEQTLSYRGNDVSAAYDLPPSSGRLERLESPL